MFVGASLCKEIIIFYEHQSKEPSWRHHMEMLSTKLALCEENPTDWRIPFTNAPVMQSFDVSMTLVWSSCWTFFFILVACGLNPIALMWRHYNGCRKVYC